MLQPTLQMISYFGFTLGLAILLLPLHLQLHSNNFIFCQCLNFSFSFIWHSNWHISTSAFTAILYRYRFSTATSTYLGISAISTISNAHSQRRAWAWLICLISESSAHCSLWSLCLLVLCLLTPDKVFYLLFIISTHFVTVDKIRVFSLGF